MMKSPFECIGLKFLLTALHVIKNDKVYGEIAKFIIQLLVNLDDSIIEKTQ